MDNGNGQPNTLYQFIFFHIVHRVNYYLFYFLTFITIYFMI